MLELAVKNALAFCPSGPTSPPLSTGSRISTASSDTRTSLSLRMRKMRMVRRSRIKSESLPRRMNIGVRSSWTCGCSGRGRRRRSWRLRPCRTPMSDWKVSLSIIVGEWFKKTEILWDRLVADIGGPYSPQKPIV